MLYYFWGERINQQILKYVQDALRQGYDLNSIRSWLLKSNVNPSELDEVIRYSSQNPLMPSNSMLEMQLRNYIQQQLRNGYGADMIRRSLIQQGHNALLVDKIINENININIRHEVHISGKTIFGIMFGLMIVAGLVYVLFFTNTILNKEIPLLDVSIQSNKDTYYAGDSITYNIELISTGSTKRFDANVRYIIIDENDAIKKSYSETLAVETRSTSSGTITIPTTLVPGNYYLKAIVDYGSDVPASSMTEIYIAERSSNQLIMPNNIISPSNYTSNASNNINNQASTARKQTFGEILTIVREQARINADLALRICDRAQSSEQKDICYSTVAEESNKAVYCDKMQKTTYKDNCYLYFIVNGNNKVCDKISDNSTKQFCRQLTIVEQMNFYYQQNNTEKILELSRQFEPSIYNNNPVPINFQNEYKKPATMTINDFMITAEINVSGNMT